MLKEVLINALREEAKKEEKKYQGMFRVSSLSVCPAKAVYDYNGEEPVIEDDKLPILTIGSRLHVMLQDYIPLKDIEKEFKRKYREKIIVGHIDGIYVDKEENEMYLVEFKTISDKKYYGGKSTKDYLPSENHVLQLHFYMRMSGIKKGKIVYLLKSSGEIVEFDFDYEEEIEKEMFKALDTAVDIVEGKTDFVDIYRDTIADKKTKWKCDYCSFSHLCEEKSKERLEEDLEYV